MVLHSADIKAWAREEGFDICGIASSRRVTECREFFDAWLGRGYDSDLDYLRRNVEVRFDPDALLPGARTVVVCAVSYRSDISLGQHDPSRPHVASYACCRDYHKSVKKMLQRLLGRIAGALPGVSGRCFTDSAPLLEKWWAMQAGVGSVGRNSLIITPEFGSFVLLGEVVVDVAADEYDAPLDWDPCRGCRLCMQSCPNGAIVGPREIDTRRCISRLTIERDSSVCRSGLSTHGWIFGCDICQSVCPHNRRAPRHVNAAFDPLFDPRGMDREYWLGLDEDAFRRDFSGTPLLRAGLERIRRTLSRSTDDGAE